MGAKLLTNFKHLKGVSTFLAILNRKQFTYKILKERRIAIASVVGLDNLGSNLQIIILHSINWLIFKYRHHLPYIQIKIPIGRVEGLYFLIKKMFNSTC